MYFFYQKNIFVQRKSLILIGIAFYIVIAIVLGYDTTEFTPITKHSNLCKHVFVLIHKQLTIGRQITKSNPFA